MQASKWTVISPFQIKTYHILFERTVISPFQEGICFLDSESVRMKKYISGKLIFSALTGALFAATEFFGAAPAFFDLFGSRASEAKNTAEFIAVLGAISAFCLLVGALFWHKVPKARK